MYATQFRLCLRKIKTLTFSNVMIFVGIPFRIYPYLDIKVLLAVGLEISIFAIWRQTRVHIMLSLSFLLVHIFINNTRK